MKGNRELPAVLVLLLVCAACAWSYWTMTPTYSLLQVRKAVASGNVDMFQRYVDLDGLLEQAMNDSMKAGERSTLQKVGQVSPGLGGAFGLSELKGNPDEMRTTIRNTVLESLRVFAAASSSVDEFEHATLGIKKTCIALVQLFGLKPDVRREEQIAYATSVLALSKEEKPVQVEFQLQAKDGIWRVSRITNIKQIVLEMERRTGLTEVASRS
ncbi:hypothetical protein [Desulfobaculum bizertense]|uniref:DUF2939 domain-containing protein n=1 Tax=Desulfobaculum bizertense DSM 18034 TaxID=1121442 RepID=A0A1T4VPQ6_9BACT|nr:hypothetical protein [Desulfobaculum bizertense]SKA66907.1 hypothetical protein SAMN02745702_00710 [Desulfobaculum bizertense DSM 18034]